MVSEDGEAHETALVDEAAPDALALATSVIFLVPDGFGDMSAEAYRHFKGSEPLWQSGFQARVQTASASSSVTDSAAAATAYATGEKTNNGNIAVDVNGNPLVSILTLAYEAAKSTGIVSTDAITGATPAAFAASNDDRDNQEEIAQDYIDRNELTVMLGGGRERFLADTDHDGATTLEEAQAAGFDYVTTADELRASDSGRLLGLFGYGPLGLPVGNRSDEPNLAEMTEAALDRLTLDEDGFFLMVEAAGTDIWGHANDAAAVMRSAEEYEDALQVALAYAADNPDTLVVSVADHETGGLQLTRNGEQTPAVFRTYDATYSEMLVEAGPLFHATSVAAYSAALYGIFTGELEWGPGWSSIGWLVALALTSQVAGWLLISRSLPRLPAAVTSVVLLLQPVGAMALAAVVLGEDPGSVQLLGALLILVGVGISTSGHQRAVTQPSPVT